MSQSIAADFFSPEEQAEWIEEPDISHLVTEDDTPVDNLLAEKQQRLLTSCLYSSWKPGVPFLATANVGLFYTVNQPAIVPDVLLSLDVEVPQDWQQKKNRSYFTWIIGKPPEVVIEIVSNNVGNELGSKMKDYARIGVAYYVVYDPLPQLGDRLLRVHELRGTSYTPLETTWMEPVGLGLTLWDGIFEGKQDTWLRWCDRDDSLIATGDERAETERQRAETERQRAERLAEILRSQGIEPNELLS
ncbi:Uma2 family endonuclease [Gloeocapsopsis sp. IPPAS B-1203]|uniref:Uma2 family endonuclease n=1 Tax=Gloeocapsopsis sp. IPPAS B-1203 TaxID=2049454 RepID=UPI000C178BFD|nr:Uma2 family endonuclease [Gloeocapsopsis sp. IPPAS B-1203]PIG94008.1 hypothetical protein CSQ79_06575 [Gloeocapsopsis sp. IPPAS B-1203]